LKESNKSNSKSKRKKSILEKVVHHFFLLFVLFSDSIINSIYSFKWLDWLVKIRDPRDAWNAQPTYLIAELTFLTIGLLTFIHCTRRLALQT